ncbi:hypothetical protein [Nitrospirillum viridazoti]|uniref:hypothetical protein n=1 Tax=Nitrospirillum viridazoti TaxID=3144925 RepID=UPI001FCB2100|nr:hypothetical protein [Nitrospirillum amazonense]
MPRGKVSNTSSVRAQAVAGTTAAPWRRAASTAAARAVHTSTWLGATRYQPILETVKNSSGVILAHRPSSI